MDAEFLESEIDWKRVLSDIENHIDSDEGAKLALKKLTLAGCNKEKILQDLYLFCGLHPEELKTAKEELAERKARVTKTIEAARTLASEIDHISIWLDEAECKECTFIPDVRDLRSYANFLERMWSILPPQKRMSGRDQHLIAVVDYVKFEVKRPRFAEIAELVNAVVILYKSEKFSAQTAEDIRKRYEYHRKLSKGKI